jgi:hypothetical protein
MRKIIDFKIGERVSVPVRFGECGIIKEIKNKRYGVEFNKLSVRLWYSADELRKMNLGEKGLTWFRMPPPD